jgi:hypothetical protein
VAQNTRLKELLSETLGAWLGINACIIPSESSWRIVTSDIDELGDLNHCLASVPDQEFALAMEFFQEEIHINSKAPWKT